MKDETTYTATLKVQWKGRPVLPSKMEDLVVLSMTNLKSNSYVIKYNNCPACKGTGLIRGRQCFICGVKYYSEKQP